jgi:predicted nucleotidyltransferase
MSAATLAKRLGPHVTDLDRLQVETLSIFGSHARGDARPDSDVDVLVRFRGKPTFKGYMELKLLLEELWECKVDLVTEAAVRKELRQRIESEAIRVA